MLISRMETSTWCLRGKHQVDAVAETHGEPTTLLPEDWTSMILKLKKHIPE